MSEKCELLEVGHKVGPLGIDIKDVGNIKKQIRNFNADLLYVNGFIFERITRDIDLTYVYDMGSFYSRNALIKKYGYDVDEMLSIPDNELVWKVENKADVGSFQKERNIIRQAKAIVSWDTKEIKLAQKLFGYEDTRHIKPILEGFSDIPIPIPFNEKKPRVIAISAKWGDVDKNAGLLDYVLKEKDITVVGHGYDNKFINHSELMTMLNDSRVLFCPYKAGGCGTVMEAVKLGCNVVAMDYYPFVKFLSKDLITDKKNVAETLDKGLKRYYEPDNKFKKEEDIINNILEICQTAIS